MATEADIPVPICDTIRELSGNIVDQATKISIDKLPQEEKTQADAPNEPPTVEGENFLIAPSIGKVCCDVNNISPDAIKATEKPDQTVRDENEILQETGPLIGEHKEPNTPHISEDDILNVQVKTTNDITVRGEKLEKEIEKLPLPEASTGGINRNESAVVDMLKDADEDHRKAELYKNEGNTSSTLPKKEAHVEKSAESLLVVPENIEVSDSGQENKKSSPEEHGINANLQGIESDDTEEKMNAVDTQNEEKMNAVDTQNEVIESLPTIVSSPPVEENSINANPVTSESMDEKTIDEVATNKEVLESFSKTASNEEIEENLTIKVDGSEIKSAERLQKESGNTSASPPLAREASNDDSPVITEAQIVEAEQSKPKLCENEKGTESMPMKIESVIDKSKDTLPVASVDIKPSDLGKEIETSSYKEQRLNERTDEETVHAAEIKEETCQNVATIVSNEKSEENSLIQTDGSKMKDEEHMEKESDKPSMIKDFTGNANDDGLTSDASQVIETPHQKVKGEPESLQETSLLLGAKEELNMPAEDLNAQVQMTDDKTGDEKTTEENSAFMETTKDVNESQGEFDNQSQTLEDATSNRNPTVADKTEESSSIQVDGSQTECDESSEKESEKLPSTEVSTGCINDNESAVDTQNKVIESLPTIVTSPPEEESINANPVTSEIMDGKTIDEVDANKEVHESFSKIASNEEIEENSTIKVDGLEIKSAEHLEKESGNTSAALPLAREASNDDSPVITEAQIVEAELSKPELCENEKGTESMPLKIESEIDETKDTLPVVSDDIKASDLGREIEQSSYKEQSLNERTDEETVHAAEIKEDTCEVQNVATIVSNEKSEENSFIQTDGSKMKDEEHMEKESDKPSMIKDFTGNANDDGLTSDASQVIETRHQKVKGEPESLQETSLLLGAKEELYMPDEDLNAQVKTKDDKTGDEKTPEENGALMETITDMNESQGEFDNQSQTLEDATSNSNPKVADKTEESSLIQVDGSQMECDEPSKKESEKLPLTEASTGCANDNKSAVDTQNKVIESLPTIVTSPEEDSINANPVTSESMDEKTIDETGTNKEVLESYSKIASNVEFKENSTIKVDDSEIKSAEHLEKESRNMSAALPLVRETTNDDSPVMTEAHIMEGELSKAALSENGKSTSLKIESEIDETEDTLPVASKDIKATFSGREIETSSCNEQSLTAHPQGLLDERTDEETVHAAEIKEETCEVQNVETMVSNEKSEEDSSIQADGSKMKVEEHMEKEHDEPSIIKDFTGNANDDGLTSNASQIAEKPHQKVKDEAESIQETSLLLRAKEELNMPGEDQTAQVKTTNDKTGVEKATEENSAFMESITDETSNSDEFQSKDYLTPSLCTEEGISIQKGDRAVEDSGILSENNVDRSQGDFADQSQTLEGIVADNTDPKVTEKTKESSLIQVDGSQTEKLEKESEKTPLTDNKSAVIEKPKDEDEDEDLRKSELFENDGNPSGTLPKEEAEMEKSVESLLVAPENIEVSNSGQENKTSSPEEQSINANLQGIKSEDVEEKTIDALDTQKEVVESSSTINSISPEEGSINADLQGVTSVSMDENTSDEVHSKTEVFENFSALASNVEIEEKSTIKVDGSEIENAEHLEKESKTMSEPLPLAREASEELMVMHEAQIEDGQLRKAEPCENEEITESVLPEIESMIDKTEESLPIAVASVDVKASDLGAEIETSSFREQSLTAHPQGILDEKTDDKTVDADGTKEELFENVATSASDEKTVENSLIQENPREGLFENEKNIERTVLEDIKASDSDQHKEKTDFLREQSLTEDPHGVLGDKTEETTMDAADSNERTQELQDTPENNKALASSEDIETTCSVEEQQSLTKNPQAIMSTETIDATDKEEVTLEVQNVETTILQQHTDENSVIQVDCTQMEDEEHLEKERETPSLLEVPTEETNEKGSNNMHDLNYGDEDITKAELLENEKNTVSSLEKEEVQVEQPIEDIKASDSSQYTKVSCIEEQILPADPQEISGEKNEEGTIDADTKEKTHEDIATNVPDVDNEDSLTIKVDDAEEPSLENISTGTANDDESTITHETELMDESAIKADFLENDENTKCILVKEEAPIEPVQVEAENITELAPVQDREASSPGEQSSTANPQEIMGDNKEDKTNDETSVKEDPPEDKNVITTIPYEGTEESLPILVDGSQMEQNEELETESYPLPETLTEHSRDNNLVVEEAHVEKLIDSLHTETEDIKASTSGQDTQTNSIEEQILPRDPYEISGDKTEDTGEDSLIQVDCSQMEQKENLEKASDSPYLVEASPEETNDEESKNMHEHKDRDDDLMNAELPENEKNTVSSLVKEEAEVEKPIGSLQVATEDIKASDSSQYTKISSLEEEILTADPQEISDEKLEEKTIDATGVKVEALEDIETNVLNGENEDNLPIKVDGSQMPSLKEALTGNSDYDESTVTQAAEFVDEGSIKADLFQNEKNTEGVLVKEEESTEPLQIEAEDIKEIASVQDIETSSLEEQSSTANPAETMSDHRENKTNDATRVEEETSEDKNDTTTISCDDTEENLLTQGDCSQMKQNEELEKESYPSLTETLTEDTIDTTLVVEEAHVEKLMDSLPAANQDIKASTSGQDTETDSIGEHIIIADPQEISGEKAEERAIDAANTNEGTFENVPPTIPHKDTGDHSTFQVDCSQMELKKNLEKASESPPLLEASTGDTTESTLVKEEAEVEKLTDEFQVDTEDIKASASGLNSETRCIEEQIRTADPQEISSDKLEEKPIDTACTRDDTLGDSVQDIASNVPDGSNEDKLPIEVDGTENLSLKEDSTGGANTDESTIAHEATSVDESPEKAGVFKTEKNTEGIILLKEETSIEPVKVAAEDIKAFASVQDGETSSPEEHSPTTGPQEIVDDHKENNANAATGVEDEAAEGIKAFASVQDGEKSSLEEHSATTNPQEIVDDHKENKTNYATGVEEENSEDKNVAPAMTQEDTKEKSQIQVDCSQTEYEEHLEKESENQSLTETPTGETKRSTSEMEEAHLEKPIDGLQVATEDINASASSQGTETSSTEDQVLPTCPLEFSGEKTEERTTDADPTNKETLDVQDIATNTQHGDNEDNSPAEADFTEKPSPEESSIVNANDNEPTIAHEDKFVDESSINENLYKDENNTGDVMVKQEESIETPHQAAEDIKAFASVQDRETSFLETPDDKVRVTNDAIAVNEETPEDKTVATTTQEDNEENSQTQVDCPQLENEEHMETKSESPSLTENPTGILVVEDAQVKKLNDPLQVATEDTETTPKEEQLLTQDPQDISGNKTEEKNIDAIANVETPAVQVPKEIENADVIAKTTESNKLVHLTDLQMTTAVSIGAHEVPEEIESVDTTEKATELNKEEGCVKGIQMTTAVNTAADEVPKEIENADVIAKTTELNKEGHLKDLEMTTAVNIAAQEENSSDATATKIPYTEGFDVDKDVIVDIAEDPNCKQEESSNTNVSEYMMISNENVATVTSSASEEVPTSIISQESRRETQQNTENEDAQKQDEDLYVLALMKDPSMEKLEKDVQVCPASARDFDITQVMQKPDEASLQSADEKMIEEDSKESEAVEYATESKYIEHLDDQKPTESEQEERECIEEDERIEQIKESASILVANDLPPKSFSETSEIDYLTSERELTIDKEVLHTGKTTTGGDEETKVDKDKGEEEEASKQSIPDISSATPDMTEARDEDVSRLPSGSPEEICTGKFTGEANISYETADARESTLINKNANLEDIYTDNRSSADLKTEKGDEAPEIIEITPPVTEGHEILSTGKEEASALKSQCETDGYKHASIGSVTAENSDSNEVEFSQGEKRSGYQSENQVLEYIVQVQSYDIISKEEEVKTEEKNLQVAGEKLEAEDIFEVKRTTHEIKEKEDENVEGRHNGSHKEEVITETREVKQEEEIKTEEIFKVTKNEDETDKASKVFEEANDKAAAEPEENLLANESIDRSLCKKEVGKSEFTTISGMGEAHGMDQSYTKTGTEDSREEVSNIAVTLPVDEDNIKGADSVDNEMMKNERLLNQNPHTSVMYAAAELPKRPDEKTICEAAPAKVVRKNDEDSECEKENANTILNERTIQETSKATEKSESRDVHKNLLSDLLQVPLKEISQMPHHSATKKEATAHREELHTRKTDECKHEDTKKDEEEESNGQGRSDLGSEAPVMVDAVEADAKVAHKKSHNILSGVGSKVKHSISKVKKAITGKSSHPKPPSPK